VQKSTQNWLMGCGCGCAVIILVILGLVASGVAWIKDTTAGFEKAVEARQALEEEFGKPKDFVPWQDGAIPAERMEAFLGIREAMEPARTKLVESMAGIPTSDEEAEELESKPFVEKVGAIFDITRAGLGLGAGMGDLFDVRNQGLLDVEMGLGEYTYIYAVAYYVWLEHPVDDNGNGLPVPNTAGRRIHRDLASILRNQRDARDDESSPSAWGEQLAAEVEALESAGERLPWEDGLPEAIVAALEPYRDRLENLYVAETNPFELARNNQRGTMTFRPD